MKPLAHERASGAETKNARSERIDAVVVCSDDGLLIELGSVLGERYRTHSVDSPAEITANVSAPRWIGLIDVDALPDARGAIARMDLQFHRCPLILISSHPQEWNTTIARGSAIAALQRQEAAGPRLLDALAAAEARLLTEPEAETSPAHGMAAASGDRAASVRRSGVRWAAAAMLGALLVSGGWWLTHRNPAAHTADLTRSAETAGSDHTAGAPGSPDAQTPAQTPASPATASEATGTTGAAASPEAAQSGAALLTSKTQSVLELLSAARVAFRDQKLLLPRPDGEPRGDSALELYAQVLSQDPGNDEALDGVRRLFVIGKARIQADLSSGKLDDASRLLALFKDAGVSDDALHDLSASIAAAKPRVIQLRVQEALSAGDLKTADQLIGQLTAMGADPNSIAQLRRTADARRLDLQLDGMATQVRSAIAAGSLLQPNDDNARTRLTAMRTLARTSPVTLAAQRDLQTALITRGLQASKDGQFDLAQRLLSAAADLGTSTQLSDARRQVQGAIAAAARRSAEAAAAAQAAAAPPAPSPPRPAAAPAAQPPPFIAARPIHPLDVAYPANTSAAGFVVVEFTLSPDGTASDMSVVSASPRGVFDQTAIDAVGRGRYDTHGLGGQPVRARILLRFMP
jgi:TonB family protein